MAKKSSAKSKRAQQLEAALIHLCSCGVTCQQRNEPDWMDYWRDELNRALEAIGGPERVKRYGNSFVFTRSR